MVRPVRWSKTNKYHVSSKEDRTCDGVVFDSKAEMLRYQELRLLEAAGRIGKLELQPAYVLIRPFTLPSGERFRGIRYVADFRYIEGRPGVEIVEDVKGHRTEAYRIKRVLLHHFYPGIHFREISF